jgi:hypothetical protein
LKGIGLAKKLLGGKSLAKKYKCFFERSRFSQNIYRFFQNIKVQPKINIGFKFCSENFFPPRRDIGLAKKKFKFCQERKF